MKTLSNCRRRWIFSYWPARRPRSSFRHHKDPPTEGRGATRGRRARSGSIGTPPDQPQVFDTAEQHKIKVFGPRKGLRASVGADAAPQPRHPGHRTAGRLKLVTDGDLNPNRWSGVPDVQVVSLWGLMDARCTRSSPRTGWCISAISSLSAIGGDNGGGASPL